MAFGSRTSGSTVEFGETCVIKPKGNHQATIVWLHGFGSDGFSCSNHLKNLPFQSIKWICPTAPTRKLSLLINSQTAWSHKLPGEVPEDFEGLDASAAHVANLLSTEPPGVILGIGGFGMGAAVALYSATCFAQGKYANGYAYPVNLRAIVGLTAWLPSSSYVSSKIEGSGDARRRAASLPILLSHRRHDPYLLYEHGENAFRTLYQAGFHSIAFKTYEEHDHCISHEEIEEVCKWLTKQGF